MSAIPDDIRKEAVEIAMGRVNGMCMTMDHSFGLQNEDEQRGLKISMTQVAQHDLAPAIAAAILAERQRNQWQDISTAPKNTAVIAHAGKTVGEACLIEYVDGPFGWYWASDRDVMSETPTHWMPFPSPPVPS